VDVRKIPRSRTNPQFNGEILAESLAPHRIGYEPIGDLGGRRNKARQTDPSLNGYWRVSGFHNYADYALTPPFTEAFAHLREIGRAHTCAIMCSEAVWWRCHRRIVTDYLLAAGETVKHILGPGHVDDATLTPGAVVRAGGSVIYPAEPAA